MVIIVIALLIILFLFGVIILSKKNKEIEILKKEQQILKTEQIELKRNEFSEELKELDDLLLQKQHQLESLGTQVKDKETYTDLILKEKQKRIEEQTEYLKRILKEGRARIDTEIEAYKQQELTKANNALKKNSTELELLLTDYKAEIKAQEDALSAELKKLQDEVEDFRKRREVINEEILRARALDEQQDFYRVQLEPDALSDISILLEVRKKLTKRENLDKLIYDNYVAKPVQEMVKRVLSGREPSGIYKITRLKTGEVYVGKSTNIKNRWQSHCKTCFGVGTIAHSQLHTTMEKDGIENFTFELLEEVPKDKLTEREKYWIKFYDTVKYGMNQKEG